MTLPSSLRLKSLSVALGVLSLLAGATGCSSSHNSEKLDLGRMLGLRPAVSDSPLIADRVELTAYDPHNHIAEIPTTPRLMQASSTAPHQPRH